MLISKIIEKIHRKFAKDTSYPETGSEDRLVILDHIDDAIDEYEDCAKEGYAFPELVSSAPLSFSGTGSDALPSDFLAFVRRFDSKKGGFRKAEILIGNSLYQEVDPKEGVEFQQRGLTPNVFWTRGGNIITVPSANGSIILPYLKKHSRYITGDEEAEPEMANPKFIEDFAVAKTFLDNADDTLYQAYFSSADEKLKRMKYDAIS